MSRKITKQGSFGYALYQLKRGKRVRRAVWDSVEGFLCLINKSIYRHIPNTEIELYLPTMEDILSEDWMIYNEKYQ